MKGEKIEKILKILQGGAEITVSLLDTFLCGYNTSYKKMRMVVGGGSVVRFKKDWAEAYQERQRFYIILSKLKKEGLVAKEINNSLSKWSITKKGLNKLQLIESRKTSDGYSADYSKYKKMSNKFCVVIFDIPEEDRRKREWLRFALSSLGFSLLQNSVWIGKNVIPEQLIYDLKEKGMMKYVHIFGVGDQGTIKILLNK